MKFKKSLDILKSFSILYLEDEKNIKENILQILKFMFKDVFEASNGKDGFEIFKNNKIDLILSDINMPLLSGIEFAKEIRKINKDVPIIFTTAHTDTKYLLEATKLKLIDYLVKPLNLDDLKKAFSIVANEYEEKNGVIITFNENIQYFMNKKQLFKNGKIIGITPKEILLLEFLYKNRDRTVTKDEIKNSLWEDYYEATDTALKSLLNKLRNKIGKESVKNISGVGYQLQTN